MCKLSWIPLMVVLVASLWEVPVSAWWEENMAKTQILEESCSLSEKFKNKESECGQKDKSKRATSHSSEMSQETRCSLFDPNYREGCPLSLSEMPISYIQENLAKLISVPIISMEEEFVDFLHKGTLQLIVFFNTDSFLSSDHLGKEHIFVDFVQNFDEAAHGLDQYDIYLALVNCSESSVLNYCFEEKSYSLAFGFQNQEEKIAFPLETLLTTDSIIASSLHLSLLYTVPILQSLTERQNLESKCRHKCDIVFTFQQSLGTKEHRLFLESSIAFKESNFVFALTTYPSGAYGLTPPPFKKKDAFDSEQVIYVLHCSGQQGEKNQGGNHKKGQSGVDPCSLVSHFPGNFNEKEFSTFLSIFALPLWSEIIVDEDSKNYRAWAACFRTGATCDDQGSMGDPHELFITPYSEVDLPWAIFVYDLESEDRVRHLVDPIAKLLRGFITVLIIEGSRLNPDLRSYLGLPSVYFEIPAILFFDPSKNPSGGVAFVSDFSAPYRWVLDQFSAYQRTRQLGKRGQHPPEVELSEPYLEPEELSEDDEMVSEMVGEELLTSVVPLEGEESLDKALNGVGLVVVAFYIPWDPICNLLLQHLHLSAGLLKEAGSWASLYRLNCYDWPKLCATFKANTAYPILKIFSAGRSKMTYNGPIEKRRIMKSILLVECERQLPLRITDEELGSFLARGIPCPSSQMANAFIAAILPSDKQAEMYQPVYDALRGYQMMAVLVSEDTSRTMCHDERDEIDVEDSPKMDTPSRSLHGCIFISKPSDEFQKSVKIPLVESSLSSLFLLAQIRHASERVLGSLDPERLELASLSSLEGNLQETIKKKKNLSFILALSPNQPVEEHTQPVMNSQESGLYETASHTKKDHDDYSQVALSLSHAHVLQTIGKLAARFSEPGIVFSYLDRSHEFWDELTNRYALKKDANNLVALNRAEGHVTVFDLSKEIDTDTVSRWIEDVIEGSLEPSVALQGSSWTPGIAGFDFLNFLEEDLAREAEEQQLTDLDIRQENRQRSARSHP